MPHNTENLPDPSPSIRASGGHPLDAERQDAADPPPWLFWRRGPRRPAEPPPPIWELPELDPPGLWTRFKQRADRWLGQPVNQRGVDAHTDTRMREDAARSATAAPSQEQPPSRNARREDTAQVRPPAASQPTRTPLPPDENAASPPISAAVLESAYEAVRQGRIGDPATIRAIAARFARITLEAAMSDDLAFDPQAVVRALRQRAAEIAQARGLDRDDEDDLSPNPSPRRGGGPDARAPRQSAPQIERDENITRGG